MHFREAKAIWNGITMSKYEELKYNEMFYSNKNMKININLTILNENSCFVYKRSHFLIIRAIQFSKCLTIGFIHSHIIYNNIF